VNRQRGHIFGVDPYRFLRELKSLLDFARHYMQFRQRNERISVLRLQFSHLLQSSFRLSEIAGDHV